jgi:hypothetical protein
MLFIGILEFGVVFGNLLVFHLSNDPFIQQSNYPLIHRSIHPGSTRSRTPSRYRPRLAGTVKPHRPIIFPSSDPPNLPFKL